MEEKINIADILKDKPQGIKLYSPLFGGVSLSYVQDGIINLMHHGGTTKFFKNGKYYAYPESEPLLFPSESMRDWSKFAWKKGDVLVSNYYSTEVIFDKWYDDTYTNFYGKHYLNSEDKNNIKYNDAFLCTTGRYSLEDKGAAQTYINTIEERLGGKLNRETLEIEKQPEKKIVIDLKPKWTPKPFDRVLVRDGKDEIWEPAFFFRNLPKLNVYRYQTVGGESRVYCIPFNEETAKLIGTTDEWKG